MHVEAHGGRAGRDLDHHGDLGSPPTGHRGHYACRSQSPVIVGPRETLDTYTSTTESWNPPIPVPVADEAGVVTVAWHHDDKLLAAQRNPAGQWGATSTLASCTKPYCVSSDYTLATDGAGTVTLLWTQINDAQPKVYVASLPRGGTWSAPVYLGLRCWGWWPALSVSRNGAVLVAYDNWPPNGGVGVTAIYRPAGAPWSAARRRVFDDAQQPAAGLSDSGTGVLVVRRTGRADNRMRAYRLRAGARVEFGRARAGDLRRPQPLGLGGCPFGRGGDGVLILRDRGRRSVFSVQHRGVQGHSDPVSGRDYWTAWAERPGAPPAIRTCLRSGRSRTRVIAPPLTRLPGPSHTGIRQRNSRDV